MAPISIPSPRTPKYWIQQTYLGIAALIFAGLAKDLNDAFPLIKEIIFDIFILFTATAFLFFLQSTIAERWPNIFKKVKVATLSSIVLTDLIVLELIIYSFHS